MATAVVLDSNALLMPFQFGFNIDQELRRLFGDIPVVVPSAVLAELANIEDKHAKAALALARRYPIVETELRGDDGVIDVAERTSEAVVTNDRELIQRLNGRNIEVVRLRSKGHLESNVY